MARYICNGKWFVLFQLRLLILFECHFYCLNSIAVLLLIILIICKFYTIFFLLLSSFSRRNYKERTNKISEIKLHLTIWIDPSWMMCCWRSITKLCDLQWPQAIKILFDVTFLFFLILYQWNFRQISSNLVTWNNIGIKDITKNKWCKKWAIK